MKRISFIVLSLLLISSFFFVSCIDLIVGLKPPEPKSPSIDNMTVTLSWGAVAKADNYLLTIAHSSEGQASRDVTLPVEEVVNGTSYTWKAPTPGVYTWKVRATNNAGASRWIKGQDFTVNAGYEAPTVTITYPAEGQMLNSLTPIIQWHVEPGPLIQTQERDTQIESCQVLISQGGESVYSVSGDLVSGNQWSAQIPVGILEYGQQYRLRVTARQEASESEGVDEQTFQAPTGIGLELSEVTMYNCGIVVATVTAFDPDMDKVALFGKLDSEIDYMQIAPSAGWRELNDQRQAIFEIDMNQLGVGHWLINAQSSGSSSKSIEKSLVIKEINLIPSLNAQLCSQSVSNGQWVYIDARSGLPATATYTVTVDLDEKLEDIISEFYYVFEYAGDDSFVQTSPRFNFDTWNATDIVLPMATEGTKAATVSLFGSSYCDAQYSDHTFGTASLAFLLDAPLPAITLEEAVFNEAKTILQIPLHLTDTQSLSQATLSFFVEKQAANGDQMAGWDVKEIPWGVETVTIGTGDNSIEGVINYSAPIVYGETTTVDATVQLALGALDGATFTATVTAIDCPPNTKNVCSDDVLRKPSSESIRVFFDNRFYQSQYTNISFLDQDDFSSLDQSWLLTKDNKTGQASFCFTDAYIDDPDDLQFSLIGSQEALTLNGTSSLKENIIAECTGYPMKNEVCLLIAMTALQDLETSVEAFITGTDQHGNAAEIIQRVLIDTLAPRLDSADGHLGQSSGNTSDDYVEFAFRVADKGQLPTFEGATVTVNGNPNKKQWYHFLGSVYDYEDQRGIVRLNEDHQFRVNFDNSSWGLIENGIVTIEMVAFDKYNNSGYTSITGDVFNP